MKQYRFINKGEIIQDGDEYLCDIKGWTRLDPPGEPLMVDGLFRREYHEPAPAPAGWILCKDRMPTEADGSKAWGVSEPHVLVFYGPPAKAQISLGAWNDKDFANRFIAWLPIPKFTPPPPEKKKVPLGPEDVPPGSELKLPLWKPGVSVSRIGAFDQGVTIQIPPEQYHLSLISYPALQNEGWEISRDGGKTWENCWKEVAGE